ncbi:hypothetical protein PHMEG_00027996 [Phytophthora megakarya]|uniref:Uncharacterized protein n=1 Tax=Phytophthora megakarya TaxID=4795 RepID=A0A225V7M0_9STRA|nr:hypothetical protein PHMEG_00027996 [Phytophthora megakarya]
MQYVVAACQSLSIYAASFSSPYFHTAVPLVLLAQLLVAKSYRWEVDDLLFLVFWVRKIRHLYKDLQHILQSLNTSKIHQMREELGRSRFKVTTIFLSFLSVRDCKATQTSPCYSGRAYFALKSLHPNIKARIRKSSGGIKPKYASR